MNTPIPLRILSVASCVFLLSADSGRGESIEGLIEPYFEIEVAASEPGVLAEIHVHEGSRVAAGQKLGQLDTSVLEATLRMASQRARSTGQLEAARAERDLYALHLERLREVEARGNAMQRELDRAEADFRVAKARVQSAEEQLALELLECERIQAQIRRREIYSPIDGVVSLVHLEQGEALVGGDSRVVTIVQLSRLRARFPLPPSSTSELQVGQSIPIDVDGLAKPATATVETISPVIDPRSSTVQVTAILDNPDERIPSGARCWLQVSTSTNDTSNYRTRLTTSDGR